MEAPYIFVSYAREDRQYVDELTAALTAAGVGVWVDHAIGYGDRWADVVRDRIDGCAAMVVVMSPAAERSDWVAREIARAEQAGRRIYPLLLEGSTFFRLGNLHYEDVRGRKVPTKTFLGSLLLIAGEMADAATAPDSQRSEPAFLRTQIIAPHSQEATAMDLRDTLGGLGVPCAASIFTTSADVNGQELVKIASWAEALILVPGPYGRYGDRIAAMAAYEFIAETAREGPSGKMKTMPYDGSVQRVYRALGR
jgi:hypothetical protein